MHNTLTSTGSNSAQPLTSIPRFGFIGTPTGAVAATQAGESSVPLGLPISNSTYSSASALCFGATSVPAHKTVSADNSTFTGRQAISSPKQSGIVNSNCEVGTSGVTNSPSTGYNNSGALVGHHKSVTKNNLLLPGFHQATVNRNGCLSNSATRLCRDFAENGTKLTRPCQIPLPPADQISASKEAFVELATSRQSTTLHSPRISLLPSLSSAPDLAAFSFSSNNKHITVSKFSTTSLHQLAQIPKMASTSSASKLTTQRLIKSQSLFASLASHQNGDLIAGTNPIARSGMIFVGCFLHLYAYSFHPLHSKNFGPFLRGNSLISSCSVPILNIKMITLTKLDALHLLVCSWSTAPKVHPTKGRCSG